MSKKNGECKKAKRDLQRQAIQSGNTKLEKKDKDAKKHLDEKIQRKKENKEQKNYLNEENDQLDDSFLNCDKKMDDENKVTDKLHLLK